MADSSNHCFHCGLPNTATADAKSKYPVVVNDETEYVCCPGCQAVCESIISLGLSDYYQFRENLPDVSPKELEADLEQLEFYDHQKVLSKYTSLDDEQNQSIALMIQGIVCSACTWLIESRISKMPGIKIISVNQTTSRALVSWDPEIVKLSEILKSINLLGYQAQPYDQKIKEQQLIDENKRALKKLAVAGLGMMQVMMYSLGFYLDTGSEMSHSTATILRWTSLLISAPVVFYSASSFYISAFKALKNKAVNMDVPVTIAIFSAWGASLYTTLMGQGEVYFDSVSMFVFFLLTGRYLQMKAIHRASRVLEFKLKSKPETALRISENVEKRVIQERVLLDDVLVDDHLLIKPGQQIPCDGIVIKGETSVDESLLTGESMPLHRKIGDNVAAGSINKGDAITIAVTKIAEDSTLNGIIKLMQRAQQDKPDIQLFADKIASYFVTMVLVVALSTGLFWLQQDSHQAFNAVLAVLVVTCPCALSLATPVAITTALGRLTSMSLILNRTKVMSSLSELTDVVFDKTGTLTTGGFSVSELDNRSEIFDSEVLYIISLIESESEHPIATAFQNNDTSTIVQEYAKKYQLDETSLISSKGIEAIISGERWMIGNSSILSNETIYSADEKLPAGQLALYLLQDEQCIAKVIVKTEIRKDAATTIEQLKSMGIKVHLLSGDQQSNVQQTADELAIDTFYGEQTPEQKLAYINALTSKGLNVAMVGDGVNDSPAMAASLVSFAIAKSTDITKTSADIVMLSDQLSSILDAIRLSKSTRRIIKQNLLWALSYNVLAIPLAVSGFITPWIAAAGMSLSSLVVVFNALRLNRRIT